MDTPSLAELRTRLTSLMLTDQHRLRRRVDGARKARDPRVRQKISSDIDTAEQRVERRRAAVPAIDYPEILPVSQKKEEILAAIRDHQVVIVAGETGSGKTTQIPKICLELGLGVQGMIGHTQPRRLAARTVADRISEELNSDDTDIVGYKMRFTDQVGPGTLVKLMTDGILLAEIQRDRMLRQYDTLIIDEAHERSLNIDFILGYLKQLLPRRRDLKVIITSATIDPQRFSRHFDDAPVVEVSGRTYPVDVRYRPIAEDDEDRDQIQAISEAVDELTTEGPGDILVFLSGEREIRDTADALKKRDLRNTDILPLYARLSAAEQHRVFQAHTRRRVVLATNVAETSLTVPGIRYVIDPGSARISRYSHRTKVQRLPIEPISQASANQRKGRCGRVAEGICIRLYAEDDFLGRPEFTDPEILRTNLASVILQMTALGLGDIAAFPFLEPPDRRNVKDGVDLLHELGALEADKLTPVGQKLARLPIDPRLARMVLEADRNGCVAEVLIITAGLSIQDPRERPADSRQAADQKHARFADKESDFLSYLNLWKYLKEQQRELSSNQFRRQCKAEYLHYLRIREWQDLHSQLRQVAKELGITPNSTPSDSTRVHVSLLAGLLSHIGLRDAEKRDYLGARNAHFAIFPGSGLFKKQPRWVMAAELVETSRLWARIAAKIEPEWVEPLAGHLVKRSYSEPHWEKDRAAVVASEKVTLYGVPIVAARKVNYGRIDPEVSRDLFIRHALVEGDWETRHPFFHENRSLLEEVEDLENRARRHDILVDDEALFEFYDGRIPADVVSGRHFDSWWRKVEQPDLLSFEKSMLIHETAPDVSARDYPDEWRKDELDLPLTYQFEPGTQADGVTVAVPLHILNQVTDGDFSWQVPGLREELVTELIRSLPKQLRRNFVPAPNFAKAALERITPGAEPLLEALERELRHLTGVTVPHNSWDLDRIPDHLKITYRVVDENDKTLAEGKSLAPLRRKLQGRLRATLTAAAPDLERSALKQWTIGSLPPIIDSKGVKAYPALTDEGDSVAVRLFATEAGQRHAMWQGTRRLIMLNVASPAKAVQSRFSNEAKLALSHNPHGGIAPLLEDCVGCAVDKVMTDCGGPAWDEEGFAKLLDRARNELPGIVLDIVAKCQRILSTARDVERRLKGTSSLVLVPALTDIRGQLAGLVYPGFVTATGWRRLLDVLRYLRAIDRRLEKLPEDPHRDRERMLVVEQCQRSYQRLLDAVPPARRSEEAIRQIRWMIEELRVSYFAQQLGTPYSISDKRIARAIQEAQS